jgi:phosphomannomutase/phosphoglucomutase
MYQIPSNLPQSVFRTYDIRGAVEADSITADLAYAIGRAIGSESFGVGQKTVVVGRDGRISGSELMAALQTGLMQAGCNVVDIGLVSSPILYFAVKHLPYRTGVMLTASHNPGNHNGFKTVLNGETLSTAGVQKIKERILRGDLPKGLMPGKCAKKSVIDAYKQCVCADIRLKRRLKVVVDSGNGMAGPFAPAIFRDLGCDVVSLYEDVDGHFPNHHPDPTIPENLVDLQRAVVENKADVGLAFDGDADRVGVVSNSGQIIWPDRQMMLFSKSVLANYPGSPIVFDVKCSTQLAAVIEENGGVPVMSQTGHSLLKKRMFDEKAPLAGEMSGHIFFNDKWLAFDDGIYVGARLLEIIAADVLTVDEHFARLPCAAFTPELKLPMAEDKKEAFMQALLKSPKLQDAKRITIDGLRVEWPDGWGLVRCSNTSAYLTMRFEGDDEFALGQVKDKFREALLAIDAHLELAW